MSDAVAGSTTRHRHAPEFSPGAGAPPEKANCSLRSRDAFMFCAAD